MAKEYVNKEALNINGGPMEAALKAYMSDKSPQNMAVFIEALSKSRFLVPVEFPKKLSEEVTEKIKKGVRLTPQEVPKMLPILLQNNQSDHFAPAYTSKEQLPKEHNYMAIMPVTMGDIVRITQIEAYKIKGILLNPNTDNVILGDKMVKLLDKVVKGAEITKVLEEEGIGPVQKQKISMTIEQFHSFARRNVELGMLPKLAFENPAKFFETVDSQGKNMLLTLYKGMYKANVPFPYKESDFDIMSLQIRDDMIITSFGFPAQNLGAGACSSGYVVWNPQTEALRYFAVEKADKGQPSRLVEAASNGKLQIIKEAPSTGSEMFEIIEFMDKQ